METDARVGAHLLIGVSDVLIGTIGAVRDLDEWLPRIALLEPVAGIDSRILFEEAVGVLVQVEVVAH